MGRTSLSEATVPRTLDTVRDEGVIPGDGLGAAGLDSSLFCHLYRNWTKPALKTDPTKAQRTKASKLSDCWLTMDNGKEWMSTHSTRQFACQTQVFGRPSQKTPLTAAASMTYCRLRSLFCIPVPTVYAESPSATQVMEERMQSQKTHPKIMITESDINAYLANETGRERLKAMYSKTESGEYSEEVNYMILTMINGCGMGLIMASVFTGFRARDDFRQKNQVTVFKTRYKAQRLMNDRILIAIAKDGCKWAFRIGIFLLPFLVVSQSIAVYRNKSSPLEYTAGSAAAGFLAKLNLGVKGGLAGGVIGGVLGLVTGSAIYGLLYAGNELQETRHYREVQARLEEQKEMEMLFGKKVSTDQEIPEAVPFV